MEMSAKRAVPRKREVLPVLKRAYRDPRFDTLSSTPLDETKAQRAYGFLDDYRASEMADLRAQIRKEKKGAAPERLEALKRQLAAMESRAKARKRREDEEAVLREHRRREKELVAQGKKPFYLKAAEQKKRVLMDRFAGMKKSEVDRAIQRKRKKVAGKEKKELDFLQGSRSRD